MVVAQSYRETLLSSGRSPFSLFPTHCNLRSHKRSTSRILPTLDVASQPRPALTVSKLDRRLREIVVTTHVRRDAVLVREAEKLRHLTDIDEVVEIYLAAHDFESIHVDSNAVHD